MGDCTGGSNPPVSSPPVAMAKGQRQSCKRKSLPFPFFRFVVLNPIFAPLKKTTAESTKGAEIADASAVNIFKPPQYPPIPKRNMTIPFAMHYTIPNISIAILAHGIYRKSTTPVAIHGHTQSTT